MTVAPTNFRERLWLAACLAAGLGVASGVLFPFLSAFWPACLAIGAVLALFAASRESFVFGFMALYLVSVGLSGRASYVRLSDLRAAVDEGGGFRSESFVVGTVGELKESGHVSFRSSKGSVPVRVVCRLDHGQQPPHVGETWSCVGWLNVGDMKDLVSERMFWATGDRSVSHRVSLSSPLSPPVVADSARRMFSERVGWGLDHDPLAADINRAILLGERRGLDRETRQVFSAAGALHIFAISGLHVMVIAKVLACLLLFTFLPVRFHGLVAIPLLWGYVLLTGAAPSAIRAGLMATLSFTAPLFWRRSNGLVAWSVTFLLVHLLDPWKIVDVGCCFSFAVMLSLVLFGRLAEGVGSRVLKLILPSCAAWAAGVPIAAHVFGHFTPGGLVSNVALLPMAALTVSAEAVGLFASFISRTVAEHFNNLSALVTRGMMGVSELVSRLPWTDVELEPWGFVTCAAWYLAMILAYFLLLGRSMKIPGG